MSKFLRYNQRNRVRISVKGLLLGIFFLTCTFDANAQLRKYLEDGQAFLARKNYDAAIEQFAEYVRLFPYNGEGYYWVAVTQMQSGNLKYAVENLNTALQLSPKYIPAYVSLGELYYNQEMYEAAIPYLKRAVELDDKNKTVLNLLGSSCYNAEKWELAVKYYSMAIKADSSFAPAWCNRGAARYNAQNIADATKIDKELAEQDLNRAILLDPAASISYRNRAFVRLFQDKIDSAYADVKRSLKLDSSDAIAYYCLARILLKQNRKLESLKQFNKAILMKGNKADFYLDRGLCWLDLNNSEAARADFYKAMELNAKLIPVGYLYISKSYAADKNKPLMLEYLVTAAKSGLFKKNYYYAVIQKDEDFKYYEKDKGYMDTMFKIKFGKY